MAALAWPSSPVAHVRLTRQPPRETQSPQGNSQSGTIESLLYAPSHNIWDDSIATSSL